MNWNRVKASLLKHIYNFKRDVFRIFDIFWWPAFQLFIWGLFSTYLSKSAAEGVNLVTILLGAVILWTFFDRASKDISLTIIDELWNKNFINLFSTPLSVSEYLLSVIIMALFKLLLSATFMIFLAVIFYSFKLTEIGWYFIPAAVGLTLAGWTVSMVVEGCILRWGHTVEVFIWAVAILVQPFSCVFYPLSSLPQWGQKTAALLPTMYLFENMRRAMTTGNVKWEEIAISFTLNIFYFILALLFFYRTYSSAQAQGSLIKNY